MRFRQSQTLLPVLMVQRAVQAVPRLMHQCQKCTTTRAGDQRRAIRVPCCAVSWGYLYLFAEDRSQCMLGFRNQRAEAIVMSIVVDCLDVFELE